ncbi:zinc finger BED domain-containing protein 4-like [Leptodactylus fuscus]
MPLPPPCTHTVGAATKSTSSSTVSSAFTARTIHRTPLAYNMCRARRCHAVLHLICLGERSHTREELLCVLHQEIEPWLSPQQLKIRTMLTNNGKSIVSALCQGGLSNMPCMTHVFNLVVKRFLKSSTHLQDILKMARKLCMHFSHSYTAKHTLLELKQQNDIPKPRLICDISAHWNSTLHMLYQLYKQRKAINNLLMSQVDRSTLLCDFNVSQWQVMHDTCRLLMPFEEATLFVSQQDYMMNIVILLIHILEKMLVNLAGQETLDVTPISHSHMNPVGAELEEEDIGAQAMYSEMGGFSTQVTGEEE